MANVVGTLIVEIIAKADQFSASMATTEARMTTIGKKAGNVGSAMTKGITLPILAIGGAAVASAMDIDKAFKVVSAGTGLTGKGLEGLKKTFTNTLKDVPESAMVVAGAMDDIADRTGLTGKSLEELTKRMLDLSRISGDDVGALAASITRAFGDWSIATDKQSEAMDWLYKVSENTGIGVASLTEKVVQFGGPMRQLGFSFEETSALLGKFEQEGVNVDLVMGSMRLALGRMAKAGEDPISTLRRVTDEIKNAGSAGEANKLALEMFGARAGPDMAAAIREGRFEIGGLMKDLQDSGVTIGDAADKAETFGDKLRELKNKAETAIEPLGKKIIDSVIKMMPAIEKVVESIAKMVEAFTHLPKWVQTGALGVLAFGAVAGPFIKVGGKIIGAVGKILGAFRKIAPGVKGAIGWFGKFGSAASGVGSAATSATGAAGGGGLLGLGAAATGVGIAIGAIAIGTYALASYLDGVANKFATTTLKAEGLAQAYRDVTANQPTGPGAAPKIPGTGMTQAEIDAQDKFAAATNHVYDILDKTGRVLGENIALYKHFDDTINLVRSGVDGLEAGFTGAFTGLDHFLRSVQNGNANMSVGIKLYQSTASKVAGLKAKMKELERTHDEGSAKYKGYAAQLKMYQDQHSATLEGMVVAAHAFGVKLDKDGLAAATKHDVDSMLKLLGSKVPEVNAQGNAMMQAIIDAEIKAHPLIAGELQNIMGSLSAKIQALPAGQLTSQKMGEMIGAEVAANPACAGAMLEVTKSMGLKVSDWDLSGMSQSKLREMEAAIRGTVGPAEFAEICRQLDSKWLALNFSPKEAHVTTYFDQVTRYFGGAAPKGHGGGLIPEALKFHSGGEVPATLLIGEFVHQRSAVQKYGVPMMKSINAGTFNPGDGGPIYVENHFEAVSPEYDSKKAARMTSLEIGKQVRQRARVT